MAVANNKVDVATNNTESIYARLQKNNMDAFKNIKEIWRSPLIPSDPMVWRKNLNDEVKQKIYFFIMQYGRFGSMEKVKKERKTLANLSDGWGPFLASSNAQLLDVRQIEAFKKKLKAQKKNDMAGVVKDEEELKKLKELSNIVGKACY